MVPAEDHAAADRAMKAIAEMVVVPANWKGSWRQNMAWRGLNSPRKYVTIDHTAEHGDDYYERPKVCFTGTGPLPRKELLNLARLSGWQAVDEPQQGLKVLVAEDPTQNTNKLKVARKRGIPIISYEEWSTLTADGEIS